MKPTLGQFEAFYWIARLGSFNAAAAKLSLTQPSVSLRMRGLEDALGVTLFDRRGRQATLTHAARALVPDVQCMLELAERLSCRRASDDPLRGHLRLGAPESVALSCMTDLLAALKKHDSELNVALTVDRTNVLCQKLVNRDLDLAFVVEPNIDATIQPHLRFSTLGVVVHSWVAAPQLGFARRWLEPHHLVEYPVFTQPQPSLLMNVVKAWFAGAKLEPSRIGTCNSLSVITRLTAAGAGIAVLPPAILANELRSGAVQLLRTRRPFVFARLFVGYQADLLGPALSAVLAIAARIARRHKLLVASADGR